MKNLTPLQALKQFSMLMMKSGYIFFSEGKFWSIKQIPLKKKLNLVKAGLDNFFRPNHAFSQPTGMMIEPTDLCNLHCTGCWANEESHKGRQRYLSIEGFKKVIDDLGSNLFIIWLWGWGEPFLNKNIYEMIRLARNKNIVVISSTNGNLQFDGSEIEELVKSGLSQLIVAIDGMDQETYGTYRIGGDLKSVLNNLTNIIEMKRRLALTTPLINMRMLVMRHNQHQIAEFCALGQSLGVDIVSFKTMCDYRKGGLNPEFPTLRQYQRYAMDDKSEAVIDIKQRFYCNRPWRRAHVFADGAVAPCEFDLGRDFLMGSVYDDQDLNSVWNNTITRQFRRQFLSDINGISFCRNCPYKNQIVWDPTVEFYHLTEAAKS
jgi:radical SAM protein with 4Fe4S-binding SPASM domain